MIRARGILIGLLLAQSAGAVDEYIDTSCALNGNGTRAGCATTGGGAGAWNVGAGVTYNAGDVFYIKRGTTVTDLPTSVSSTVAFDDYGDPTLARPVIRKSNTTFTLSVSAADVVFRDVSLAGSQSSAIVSTVSARTRFHGVEFMENYTANGVGLRFNSSSSDGLCESCEFHHIQDDAVNISATATGTFTFTDPVCRDIDLGFSNGDCIQSNDSSVANLVVTRGRMRKESPFKQAIRYHGTGTLTIDGTEFDVERGCCDGVNGAQAISIGGSGAATISRIFAKGNTEAPIIFHDSTGALVLNGAALRGGEAAVWSSHASGAVTARFVSAVGQSLYGFYHTTGGSMDIRDSYVDAPTNIYDASAGATTTSDFNRFGAGGFRLDGAAHATLAAWQSASSQDANSLVLANPGFRSSDPRTLSDFRPGATSWLCGAGTPVVAGVTKTGRRLGPRPDVGALECFPPSATLR